MPRSVAASPPVFRPQFPLLLRRPSQARAAAPAGLLVCKALGQPLYFPAVCRLGFCLAAAASAAASAGAIYCCSFGHASCAATAIVSVYLFTFALYYSPLT